MSIAAAFALPHPPMLIPEIGEDRLDGVRSTERAYLSAMKSAAALRPEAIVIASPHAPMYSDYLYIADGSAAQGGFARFGAPDVRISVSFDERLRAELCECCKAEGLCAGTEGGSSALDHGTMLPLYFLEQFMKLPPVVLLGVSGLSPEEHFLLGQCVSRAADKTGRRTVFIASGDLSHKLKREGPYGYAEQGPVFDGMITEIFKSGELSRLFELPRDICDKAAECGLRSFWIMAGALSGKSHTSGLLSYEGPFGVGYAVASFIVQALPAEEEKPGSADEYVALARLSVESFVKTGKRAKMPPGLPDELTGRKGAVFVSLKKNGELRGCIGTIMPACDSVAAEIIENAVSACSRDPRFSPVVPSELGSLTYSVDVLTEPEDIESARQLDPSRYGVIVRCGARRGLLLPALEGVDTVEAQLAIARRKAGIDDREPVLLQRFEVVRHK